MDKEKQKKLYKLLEDFTGSIALICSLHAIHSPGRYKAFTKSRSKILKRIEKLIDSEVQNG